LVLALLERFLVFSFPKLLKAPSRSFSSHSSMLHPLGVLIRAFSFATKLVLPHTLANLQNGVGLFAGKGFPDPAGECLFSRKVISVATLSSFVSAREQDRY